MKIIDQKAISGIYAIRNTTNNKQYVGSSANIRIRQKLHVNVLIRNKHHSIVLQRAWNKYGRDAFEFQILEEVNVEDLLVREQFYIDNHKPEYNICPIAGSSRGKLVSEETRKKMSLLRRGVKHSEERNRIKSIAQGGDNHWTRKKKFTDEAKQRMSDAQKKLYTNGYISPRKGRKMPSECVEASRVRNSIPVDQLTIDGEFIKQWPSAKAVELEIGIYATNIGAACKGKVKQAKGFKWKYTTKQ